ncbi:MAG: hypothetical protein ACI4GO_10735 [Hominenteromicrobium sp.]
MQRKTDNPVQKRILFLTVWVVLLLVLACMLCALLFSAPGGQTETVRNTGVVLDKDAVAFTGDTASSSENQEQLSIRFPVYPEITITADKTYIPIVLANPEGNPCYFAFCVSVRESGEPLYQSDMVAPGMAIEGFSLKQTLEPGTYTLVIDVATSSLEDQAEMNGGSVETVLHVTD